MTEHTRFVVEADVNGESMMATMKAVSGNCPKAITRKRLLAVMAAAMLSIIRDDDAGDGFTETQLMAYAVNELNESYADPEAYAWRTPR